MNEIQILAVKADLLALQAECNERYEAFDGGDTSSEHYLIAAAYAWCGCRIQGILASMKNDE